MKLILKVKSTGEDLMVCDLWHLILGKLFTGTFIYNGRIDDLKLEINGVNVPIPEEYK